jgi:hypothetical protein
MCERRPAIYVCPTEFGKQKKIAFIFSLRFSVSFRMMIQKMAFIFSQLQNSRSTEAHTV